MQRVINQYLKQHHEYTKGDNMTGDSGINMAVFNEFKEGLNKRLDTTDGKIDKVDKKVDILHDKVNSLELKVIEYRTETRQFRNEFDQNTKTKCYNHDKLIEQLRDNQIEMKTKLNMETNEDIKVSLGKRIINKVLPKDWKFILITAIIVTGIVLITLGIFTDVLG